MSLTTFALLVAGLVLLVAGAEGFVRGASRLAARVGISPLVIGLTVVALGTSSPEIAVSVQSAMAGAPELALGNVVGSNVCNVLLILGLAATIAPLVVAQQLVRLDVPVMIAASFALLLLAADGSLGRSDATLLLAAALVYTTALIFLGRRESAGGRQTGPDSREDGVRRPSALTNIFLVVAGLALLVFGSRLLVDGAVSMAQALGVSELVIGLTVVAIGTSLPELATSIIAMIRGQRDLAVGNAVGSNIFNILLVLGTSAMAAPGGIPIAPAVLRFDLPVMIVVAVACLPIFATGHRINRWEGLLFLGYYAAYTGYLILASGQHDALPVFSAIMGLFVIPLTVVTLVIISTRAWRRSRMVDQASIS